MAGIKLLQTETEADKESLRLTDGSDKDKRKLQAGRQNQRGCLTQVYRVLVNEAEVFCLD